MSFYSRRKIQQLLNDLTGLLEDQKRKSLLGDLNSKDAGNQLGAEAELIVLSAVSRTGHLKVEPEQSFDNKRPDGYSETIIKGTPVIFDITAISDGALSHTHAMKIAARNVVHEVNLIKQGKGKKLSFSFQDADYYIGKSIIRKVMVKDNYSLSEAAQQNIRTWLETDQYLSKPLSVVDGETQFKLTFGAKTYNDPPVHTTMPTQCYSLDKNPIYNALKKKKKQLINASPNTLKIIFLVDASSRLLNQIDKPLYRFHNDKQVSGAEIINHFLSGSGNKIDGVIVLSPKGHKNYSNSGQLAPPNQLPHWHLKTFTTSLSDKQISEINLLTSYLPIPSRNAESARQSANNNQFKKAGTARYKMNNYLYQKDPYMRKIKFSAGALRDLMIGNLSADEFRAHCDYEGKLEKILKNKSITSVAFESCEQECDDDFVVLSLDKDPAVAPYE